ncbi:SlyX family protein [Microvirga pudoricolor]|uniref:SlyX family protein n=1 Tax=Microvirga pudoricolor TaxID=2778729 RepID=UPI00194E3EF8|nr:SlyX family protein [Microvirga pudoricolor]MBM6594651.1 SlyX family protein [Microvirga pudoricolor]
MSETGDLSARIDDLEMRIAHQDRTIEDLNTAIVDQWKQIDALSRKLSNLLDRVQEVEDSAGPPVDRPPPHY